MKFNIHKKITCTRTDSGFSFVKTFRVCGHVDENINLAEPAAEIGEVNYEEEEENYDKMLMLSLLKLEPF